MKRACSSAVHTRRGFLREARAPLPPDPLSPPPDQATHPNMLTVQVSSLRASEPPKQALASFPHVCMSMHLMACTSCEI